MLQFESRAALDKYIQEELLCVSEVIEILGFSRQYMSVLVQQGKLQPVKETKRERLFWKSDVLKLIKK